VSDTTNPTRRHTLKKRLTRLLKRPDRMAFEYSREEYPQEADSQPRAELSASRSSQELSTFAPASHELMGTEVLGWETYSTGPAMSQVSGGASPPDNLSLNTAQQSNYTPETMSFGQSYDSSPISPETPRPEGLGHRSMARFSDDSVNALLFGNMERRPSFATSQSSFEVSPNTATGDCAYNHQTEGPGHLHRNNTNPSSYPTHAAQDDFYRHQSPWYIDNGTQFSTLPGTVSPGWNNIPSQQSWPGGQPPMHASPPGVFYPITHPDQLHQSTSSESQQHHENASQLLSQGGPGVIEDTSYPPVACIMCKTLFTGK